MNAGKVRSACSTYEYIYGLVNNPETWASKAG